MVQFLCIHLQSKQKQNSGKNNKRESKKDKPKVTV